MPTQPLTDGKCVRERSCAGGLGDELREVFGCWADDVQSRACGRVGEGEGDGVKQGTIRLVGSFGAVEPVSEDRMTGVG